MDMDAGADAAARRMEPSAPSTDRYDDIYSLAISMHEFEPFLEHADGAVDVFFGVQCGERDASFRSVVSFIHSRRGRSERAGGRQPRALRLSLIHI